MGHLGEQSSKPPPGLAAGDLAALFAVEMAEFYVFCGRWDEKTCPFGPLDDKNRSIGKVVLPTDRDYVILAVKTVEIHVNKHRRSARLDFAGAMLLDYAESWACDAPFDAKRLGETLGKGRLAGAEVAFEADDITRLERSGDFSRKRPCLLDAVDLSRHLRSPSAASSLNASAT